MNETGLRMVEIPPGKSVADLLPDYASVKAVIGPIGMPAKVCASCVRPFSSTRRPRLVLRFYPSRAPGLASFIYRICGQCKREYCAGGIRREVVLSAIQNFMLGRE